MDDSESDIPDSFVKNFLVKLTRLVVYLLIIRHKGLESMTEKPRRKRWRLSVIVSVLLLVLVIFYIDSNVRLVTSEFELFYPNLPQGFDGFRIVVLSDLHGAEFGRDNERLVRRVIEAEPNIIALTGDFIDEYNMPPIERQLEITDTLAARLTEIAPVYFVTGNHDWASKELPALLEVLENNDVTVLRNSHTLLTSGSDSIILAGTDDPNGPADMIRPREFVQKVREAEGDGFFIMLEHRNRNLQPYSDLGVDLVLSGHSHGGIIRLPFTDGLIDSRIGLFPEHASGVNTIGETNMVVSRGLGSWVMWMRVFNNPEVVVVELRVES